MTQRFACIVVIAIALSCDTIDAEDATNSRDQESARPNVIMLLADDLGWNGIGCFGSDLHQTPNLDRLAADGMRFTNAYAACTVCSPTRAALMTGKYPARLHLTDWISGQKRPTARLKIPDWTMFLEHRHETLPELLQRAGYATAHIGKWHLGGQDYFPEKHGFDVNVAGTHAGGPSGGYLLPNKMKLPGAKEGQYLTDYLTDRAVELIDRWKDRPFFIYFPYYVVHTPIQGRPDLVAKYERRIDSTATHKNPRYAAMATSLDQSVGRIHAALEQAEIADRTVILFSSDNGGLSHKFGRKTGITMNTPLRRGKGSAYEGGVRVPTIVYWPGVTSPGSECKEPISTIDLYSTILDIAQVDVSATTRKTIDGVSLVPLLKDSEARLDREAIYWHYPHYHAGGDALPGEPNNGPYGAVRAGDWKLIEYYEDDRVELYHLKNDLGEKKDLAKAEPMKAEQLRDMLHRWRQSVAAQMPTQNPNYAPTTKRRKPR